MTKMDYQHNLQLEADRTVVQCLHRLIEADDFQDAVQAILETVLFYYKGERAYIFEFDWNMRTASNTFEVCREGVGPEKDNLQEVPLDIMHFWIEQFKTKSLIQIHDLHTLGSEREEEYKTLAAQGIQTLIAVPFAVGDDLRGFIVVDDPTANTDDAEFLRNLAYFISRETEQRRLNIQISDMSNTDALTGLYNRHMFARYKNDFERRSFKSLGIVVVDINGLKQMNEAYGHEYGDIVITHVSGLLKEQFPEDILFRMSGDEFIGICEDIDCDSFYSKVKSLRASFTEERRHIATCGCVWTEEKIALGKLVSQADKLMYVNKQEYYGQNLDSYAHSPVLLKKLLDSLLHQEYMLYLQPKMDLHTGRIFGAEVLIRYMDKNEGITEPSKFIPILEKEGLISHIDYFVLQEACRLLQRWRKEHRAKMALSLNLSRVTMFEDGFVEKITDVCRKNDIPCSDLELEVTETQEMLDRWQLANVIARLRKQGFPIALDDFGAEYSFLGLLSISDVDVMKIDKSITQKVKKSPRNDVILESLIEMSHKLQMLCIAEGVETEEQKLLLERMGCDHIQGYLLDKPMSVSEFERKYL